MPYTFRVKLDANGSKCTLRDERKGNVVRAPQRVTRNMQKCYYEWIANKANGCEISMQRTINVMILAWIWFLEEDLSKKNVGPELRQYRFCLNKSNFRKQSEKSMHRYTHTCSFEKWTNFRFVADFIGEVASDQWPKPIQTVVDFLATYFIHTWLNFFSFLVIINLCAQWNR